MNHPKSQRSTRRRTAFARPSTGAAMSAVLLLVACCAAAETYPAAFVERVGTTDAAALASLRLVPHDSGPGAIGRFTAAQTYLHADAGRNPWYKVQPHPYLARVLSGVSFYLTPSTPSFPGCYGGHDLLARWNEELYEMPYQLNSLLRDRGMEFTDSSAVLWARVLVLFDVAERSKVATVRGWTGYDQEGKESALLVTTGEHPFFPAITFTSVRVETASLQNKEKYEVWTAPGHVLAVAVHYRADTLRDSVIVAMARGQDLKGDLVIFPYSINSYTLELLYLSAADTAPAELEMCGHAEPRFREHAAAVVTSPKL